MEALAGIFVTLITTINSVVPQANLPQILGVAAPQIQTQAVLSETDEGQESSISAKLGNQRLKKIQANALERAKDKRVEFQKKLSQIKDIRKQNVIEGIDQRIVTHNNRWVNHWNEVLERLRGVVLRIQSLADKAESQGKDISAIETRIASANTAIETAQAAIDAQAGKTYAITITSENNLREDVQPTIQQFKSDIKIVSDNIKTARLAVHEAFKSLRDIHGSDRPKTILDSTPSAESTESGETENE